MPRGQLFGSFMFAIVVVSTACGNLTRIPEPRDTRYEATCECQVCTTFDPQTGACTSTTPKDNPLFACSIQSKDVDETVLETEFRDECMLGNHIGDVQTCDLMPLDSPTG